MRGHQEGQCEGTSESLLLGSRKGWLWGAYSAVRE